MFFFFGSNPVKTHKGPFVIPLCNVRYRVDRQTGLGLCHLSVSLLIEKGNKLRSLFQDVVFILVFCPWHSDNSHRKS